MGRPRSDRGGSRRRAGRVTVELVANGARSVARRTWPTGPDRPRRVAPRSAGQVHALPRGVAADPPETPPIRMEYWAGCDAEGLLTALRARMVGDSGPYASVGMKVLERSAGHASGPYMVPAIDVESMAARTNNPVCGAFRGFGANQAQFAMEGVLDRLAEAVGISGWEIRARNVVAPGAVWGPGQVMDDGCLGARAASTRSSPRTTRRSVGQRRWASVSDSRTLGSATDSRRSRKRGRPVRRGRQRRGTPLLDRDGPGRAHRRAAGGDRRARRRRRSCAGHRRHDAASSAPGRPLAAEAR